MKDWLSFSNSDIQQQLKVMLKQMGRSLQSEHIEIRRYGISAYHMCQTSH
jgi:ribulose bisphosphate carboxylase small subunit